MGKKSTPKGALVGPLDLAGAQAAGTNIDSFGSFSHDDLYSLEVWGPAPFCFNVGMAD